MVTRDQQRGDLAFRHVSGIRGGDEVARYGQYAHKLPVLIRQAGLAQALTFASAKKAGLLLDHLAEQLHVARLIDGKEAQDLLESARTADLMTYQRLTREVMAALLWYKRFVESVLEVTVGDDKAAR